MSVGRSRPCEHKFKYIFRDTLNPICNCGEDFETSSHYLLHCLDYLQEMMTLLNIVSCIAPNNSDLNNAQLTEVLLCSKENLDNINSRSTMDATINFLIETKRFDAQLFECSLDVMALTLILL